MPRDIPPDLHLGTAGDDTLKGGHGDDRLVGLGGVDVLNGGKGPDIFVFGPGDSGLGAAADTIRHFGSKDLIEFDGFGRGASWAVVTTEDGDRVQVIKGGAVVAEILVENHYVWGNDDILFV